MFEGNILHILLESLTDLGKLFLSLAPFLLLGLFLAGLLHVLVSKKQVAYLGGDPGLKGIFRMSLLGVTLPVCSCGVAPVAVELKRKGASLQSIISFLILAPETSIDTILVTWGLLGPAMAITRPICGYLLGIIGGFFGIGLLREKDETQVKEPVRHECEICHSHDSEELDEEEGYVGFKTFSHSFQVLPSRFYHWVSSSRFFYAWYRPRLLDNEKIAPYRPEGSLTLTAILRRIFHYSYGHLADDILPSLLTGLVITFFLFLILPNDLSRFAIIKHGLFPYILMFLAGIPLYVCASEGTLMAAAFIYKGISPGAALVFLLTGPVSNIPTVVILMRYFGKKFVRIYLLVVMIGGILFGILFDYFLKATHFEVKTALESRQPLALAVMWISASLLIFLAIYRFFWGHLKEEFVVLWSSVKDGLPLFSGLDGSQPWYRHFGWRSRWIRYLVILAVILYIASGLSVVPIGGSGYVKVFGKVVWRDWQPGLYYRPPYPFSVLDIWFPTFPIDIVVQCDNKKKSVEMLSGDEFLASLAASIQYVIRDPYRYYYQINQPENMVRNFLQESLTEVTAQEDFIAIMTSRRGSYQRNVEKGLMEAFNIEERKRGLENLGVEIVSVNILKLTPPKEALPAFQDVVSAREDRETYNLRALSSLIRTILTTRGQANFELARAVAEAYTEKVKAHGKLEEITALSAVVSKQREILENLLWLQTSEKALSKSEQVYFLPPGSPPQKFTLWRGKGELLENKEKLKLKPIKKEEEKKDKKEEKKQNE